MSFQMDQQQDYPNHQHVFPFRMVHHVVYSRDYNGIQQYYNRQLNHQINEYGYHFFHLDLNL